MHLLLYGSLLDLIQLHVEARPQLLQLQVFSRAFSAKRVRGKPIGVQEQYTVQHVVQQRQACLYKWWRNWMLSLRLAKVMIRLLSALGTGNMCFKMVAVRWPRLLRLRNTKSVSNTKLEPEQETARTCCRR